LRLPPTNAALAWKLPLARTRRSWERGLDAPSARALSGFLRPGSPSSTRSSPIPRRTRFRARHDFRRTIEIPGFHATTWYDIFQTSVIAAFNDIQARAGHQVLWIGPNHHYFIYEANSGRAIRTSSGSVTG